MSATGTKDDLRRQQSTAHYGIPFINHQNETMTTTTSIDQKVRETGDGAWKETGRGSAQGMGNCKKMPQNCLVFLHFQTPSQTPKRGQGKQRTKS